MVSVADPSACAPSLVRLLWSTLVPLSLALGGVGWAVASLAPGGDLPAWPAVSLGLIALGLSLPRGPALPRAFASLMGALAVTVGGGQIALLWVAARAAESYM